jgi:hypothetical protein
MCGCVTSVKTGKSLTIPVRCRPAPDAIGFDTNATVVELNAPVALLMYCRPQIQSPRGFARFSKKRS